MQTGTYFPFPALNSEVWSTCKRQNETEWIFAALSQRVYIYWQCVLPKTEVNWSWIRKIDGVNLKIKCYLTEPKAEVYFSDGFLRSHIQLMYDGRESSPHCHLRKHMQKDKKLINFTTNALWIPNSQMCYKFRKRK